jgi:hypothetical protein
VAESDGQLLGLAHFLFHRCTISIEPFCYMPDLFPTEAVRGKGVRRTLINGVYQQAGSSQRRVFTGTPTNRTTPPFSFTIKLPIHPDLWSIANSSVCTMHSPTSGDRDTFYG